MVNEIIFVSENYEHYEESLKIKYNWRFNHRKSKDKKLKSIK